MTVFIIRNPISLGAISFNFFYSCKRTYLYSSTPRVRSEGVSISAVGNYITCHPLVQILSTLC